VNRLPETEEARALHELQALILEGALPLGEFLSQRMLAAKVSTTLITVRAALRTLEQDGLIENVPHWGVRIPLEGESQLRDRYFVREVLEVAAARRVAERVTDVHSSARLRELASACDVMEVDPQRVSEFASAHFELHLAISEAAGSPALAQQLRRISLRSLMLGNAKRVWSRVAHPADWHSALIADLLSGDPVRAESAMRNHVRTGLNNEVRSLLADQSQSPT
jgi:DNA-binding GntR family transcriptional regulator